jgi:integrase/recombinase XerD
MAYSALWAMIRNLGVYAGVANVHPHILRHTAATELYRETKDIMKVKSFLGHSKVQTTERYLKRLGVELAEEDYRTPDEWLT